MKLIKRLIERIFLEESYEVDEKVKLRLRS